MLYIIYNFCSNVFPTLVVAYQFYIYVLKSCKSKTCGNLLASLKLEFQSISRLTYNFKKQVFKAYQMNLNQSRCHILPIKAYIFDNFDGKKVGDFQRLCLEQLSTFLSKLQIYSIWQQTNKKRKVITQEFQDFLRIGYVNVSSR